MLKKILITCICALLLTACGDTTATPDATVVSETSNAFVGVVKPLGANVYHVGTHRLEHDGKLVALLESGDSDVVLDNFVGQEVTVTGEKEKVTGGDVDIITVESITPSTPTVPTTTVPVAPATYTDTDFGFSVKYAAALELQQGRTGVAFALDKQKIIEISAIENRFKIPLQKFLTETYGYTTAQLAKVAVGALGGYAFKNATGEVVYFARDAYVYAIAWFDVATEKRAESKRYFLEIIQQFSLVNVGVAESTEGRKVAGLGEFCGGIAGLTCARGLACQLDGVHPDAGGTCIVDTGKTPNPADATVVRAASVPDNTTLPLISDEEISRGWYYGDATTKKPGTPADWQLVDGGTRFAMWRGTPPAATTVLSTPTTTVQTLPNNKKLVFDYLTSAIATVAPEAAASGRWTLRQLAFAEPAYVYATYSAAGETRRALFVYTVVDNTPALKLQAYFRPGTDRDWLLAEGTDLAAGKELTIVDAGGNVASVIAPGFKEYSHRAGFRLQYPAGWYWKNTTNQQATFSPKNDGVAVVTLEIVDGTQFVFDTLTTTGDIVTGYVRFTDKQSVKFSGQKAYSGTIDTMQKTFTH